MKILVACVLWTVLVLIMSSQGSLFEKKGIIQRVRTRKAM